MGTIQTLEIGSWREYREFADGPAFRSWAFRGQADASWPLYTSLARYLLKTGVHKDAWAPQEDRIIRIFQRKSHLFLDHVPKADDIFQWLALMQHHGAPTRLLDFTWSPYVAAFFALEQATANAAVWAVCPPKVLKVVDGIMPKLADLAAESFNFRGADNFRKYLLSGEHSFLFMGEPYAMNQRLIAQEGTFGVPGVVDRPVEEILTTDHPDGTIVKIVLHTEALRREAMYSLYNMNITNATLFPGLDGLARSLAFELEHHWAFNPYDMSPIREWESYDQHLGVLLNDNPPA
jgi:hypothetical protein